MIVPAILVIRPTMVGPVTKTTGTLTMTVTFPVLTVPTCCSSMEYGGLDDQAEFAWMA